MAREAREAKAARQEEKKRAKDEKERAKAIARAVRAERSEAFKTNVEKLGLPKAKFIANIISKKKKGTYCYTPKDGVRAK